MVIDVALFKLKLPQGMWQRTAVREATQSHASESPVPGEHTDV
jgi:hypothetical protein